MTSAYVYYRIDPAQTLLAAARIDALLAVMAAHCSAPPRRLQRCDDASTWMEVYEGIADRAVFDAALHAGVAAQGCTAFIQDDRHLECFAEAGFTP